MMGSLPQPHTDSGTPNAMIKITPLLRLLLQGLLRVLVV